MSEVLGQTASLTAALLWATAVVAFRGPIAAWGAATTNLVKCLIATALLALTLPVIGGFSDFAATPGRDLVFIAASGVVGLSLGDTFLFAAVRRLGAHTTLVLHTTAPVFAGLLAAAAGERLSPTQLAGAAVVLGGIVMVVGPGRRRDATGPRRHPVGGIVLALLAAVGQGAGVVLAKEGLATIGALPATFLRLGAGSLGLLAAAAVGGGLARLGAAFSDRRSMARAVPAAFFGTYLALLLATVGIALAPATIAAVLLATSPIFSLVVEAAADRRRPTVTAVVGTAIAVAGVALLVGGS